MITKDLATRLSIGRILYHATQRNADGSALRARVNGKCITYKRDVTRWRLPMIQGLYTRFSISNDDAGEWLMDDPTRAHLQMHLTQ